MNNANEGELDRAANRAAKYSALVMEDMRAGVPPREIVLAMWIAAGALGVPNHMAPSPAAASHRGGDYE